MSSKEPSITLRDLKGFSTALKTITLPISLSTPIRVFKSYWVYLCQQQSIRHGLLLPV